MAPPISGKSSPETNHLACAERRDDGEAGL
jgi:hypothetical protein